MEEQLINESNHLSDTFSDIITEVLLWGCGTVVDKFPPPPGIIINGVWFKTATAG
jgi:hypothetical protein